MAMLVLIISSGEKVVISISGLLYKLFNSLTSSYSAVSTTAETVFTAATTSSVVAEPVFVILYAYT